MLHFFSWIQSLGVTGWWFDVYVTVALGIFGVVVALLAHNGHLDEAKENRFVLTFSGVCILFVAMAWPITTAAVFAVWLFKGLFSVEAARS